MAENFDSAHTIDHDLLQPGPGWNYPNWPRDAVTGVPLVPLTRYARGVTGELFEIRNYETRGPAAYPLGGKSAIIYPPIILPEL